MGYILIQWLVEHLNQQCHYLRSESHTINNGSRTLPFSLFSSSACLLDERPKLVSALLFLIGEIFRHLKVFFFHNICISRLFMFSFTVAISAVFFNMIFSKFEKHSSRLLMAFSMSELETSSSSISEQRFLGLGLWRGEAGNAQPSVSMVWNIVHY